LKTLKTRGIADDIVGQVGSWNFSSGSLREGMAWRSDLRLCLSASSGNFSSISLSVARWRNIVSGSAGGISGVSVLCAPFAAEKRPRGNENDEGCNNHQKGNHAVMSINDLFGCRLRYHFPETVTLCKVYKDLTYDIGTFFIKVEGCGLKGGFFSARGIFQ
jgi:hypothetical protein